MSRGDPLRVRDYLEHIAEAIANIVDYTAGMDAAAYLADRKTQDAVIRDLVGVDDDQSACYGSTVPLPPPRPHGPPVLTL